MTVSLQQSRIAAAVQGSPVGVHGRPAKYPGRRAAPLRTLRPVACEGVLDARRPGVRLWLAARVLAVIVLIVAGFAVSVVEMASWAQPDPAIEYVKGDPAWAHVDGSLTRP